MDHGLGAKGALDFIIYPAAKMKQNPLRFGSMVWAPSARFGREQVRSDIVRYE